MFIDSVKIKIIGGKGGNGIIAFRREKYVPLGGPAGGSGGSGGDVIFKVDLGLRTLLDFRYNHNYQAPNGENGKSKSMHGKNAENLILNVPPGTMIYNDDTNDLIVDLVQKNQQEILVQGGCGGRGNAELAKAGKHSLEISENGEPGETLNIRLELKLISDVGLVGLPSVGKSSFISVVSKAKPKIAAYHFTTLKPNLGMVKTRDNRSFVIADLPGLIKGAAEGKGLGLQFLKHIERTKILLHIIDMGSFEGRDPLEDYKVITEELESYKMDLEKKKTIVVANKMDLPAADENLKQFQKKYSELEIFPISTITKKGIDSLLLFVADQLENYQKISSTERPSQKIYEFKEKEEFKIEKKGQNHYCVTGPAIIRLLAMTNFKTYDNVRRLANQLDSLGVNNALKEKGIQAGDSVELEGFEFEFEE